MPETWKNESPWVWSQDWQTALQHLVPASHPPWASLWRLRPARLHSHCLPYESLQTASVFPRTGLCIHYTFLLGILFHHLLCVSLPIHQLSETSWPPCSVTFTPLAASWCFKTPLYLELCILCCFISDFPSLPLEFKLCVRLYRDHAHLARHCVFSIQNCVWFKDNREFALFFFLSFLFVFVFSRQGFSA